LRAVIFANGLLTDSQQVQRLLRPDDYLIAADGGARYCLRLGLRLHLAIGDFDSLETEYLAELQAAGVPVRRFPAEKDETDLELALLAAREAGADEVIILGALGGRWDMTLSNILLLVHAGFQQINLSLVDGSQEIRLLSPGRTWEINGQPGDTVSLIPLQGDAEGISSHGLRYPLREGVLHFGVGRGVSNVLLENPAQVSLRKGLLVCILIHQNQPEE